MNNDQLILKYIVAITSLSPEFTSDVIFEEDKDSDCIARYIYEEVIILALKHFYEKFPVDKELINKLKSIDIYNYNSIPDLCCKDCKIKRLVTPKIMGEVLKMYVFYSD